MVCNLLGAEDSVEKQTKNAERYVDLEEYAQARTLYKNIDSRTKDGWKKAILHYDIGTTYLLEGDYLSAGKIFDKISFGKNPFPGFVVNVKANESTALFSSVLAAKNKDNLSFTIAQLSDALHNIEEIDSEISDETFSAYLENMKKNLRKEIISDRQLLFDNQKQKMSEESFIPFLQATLAIVEKKIKIIQKNQDQTIAVTQQLHKISSELNSMLPPIEEKEKTFSIGLFTSLIEKIHSGNIPEAFIQISEMQKMLSKEFIVLIKKQTPAEISVSIREIFQNITGSEFIQPRSLLSLQYFVKIAGDIFYERNFFDDIWNEIENNLKKSIGECEKGDNEKAKIFFLVAYTKFIRFFQNHDEKSEFLANLIVMQNTTGQITNLIQNISENYLPIAINAQKETLATAELFWNVARSIQNENFSGTINPDDEKSTSCQYNPWSEVIKIFNEGYESGKESLFYLESKNPNLEHIFMLQKKTAEKWEKAEDMLKNPNKSQPGCTLHDSPQQKEPTKQPSNPQQNPQNSPWNGSDDQVLRLLQKMEQDDRIEKKGNASGKGSEEKLW